MRPHSEKAYELGYLEHLADKRREPDWEEYGLTRSAAQLARQRAKRLADRIKRGQRSKVVT